MYLNPMHVSINVFCVAGETNSLQVGHQVFRIRLQHNKDEEGDESVGAFLARDVSYQPFTVHRDINLEQTRQVSDVKLTKDHFAAVQDADHLVPWCLVAVDLEQLAPSKVEEPLHLSLLML
jgi:hypothetical protein